MHIKVFIMAFYRLKVQLEMATSTSMYTFRKLCSEVIKDEETLPCIGYNREVFYCQLLEMCQSVESFLEREYFRGGAHARDVKLCPVSGMRAFMQEVTSRWMRYLLLVVEGSSSKCSNARGWTFAEYHCRLVQFS